MVDELKLAISNLEERVDLNEIMTIKDKSLKDSIKRELKLSSDNITIGDMYKLTKLSVVGSVCARKTPSTVAK